MKTETEIKPAAKYTNKAAYIIFSLAGIYFLAKKDFSGALTFWGLALVFDPFNTEMPFARRPFYQKVWLYAHVCITIALLVFMLLGK